MPSLQIDATASEILAVSDDQPERVFPMDEPGATRVWRNFAKAWHPDLSSDPKAREVFDHVARLRSNAAKRRADGIWRTSERIDFLTTKGRRYRLRVRAMWETELGWLVLGRGASAILTRKEEADLHRHGDRIIKSLGFADSGMRCEFASRLPKAISSFETPGYLVTVYETPTDLVGLHDLRDQLGGTVEPRHVAWLIGSLLNLTCYLEWAGIAHQAIGPDTWLVSPERHDGVLLGGWAYAGRVGHRLRAAPSRTVAAAPTAWRREKRVLTSIDRLLVKQTARELLGHDDGRAPPNAIPESLRRWVDRPLSATAVEDYRSWQTAVEAAFGPARFIDLGITPDGLYQRKGER